MNFHKHRGVITFPNFTRYVNKKIEQASKDLLFTINILKAIVK